jgi:hypothetical protein
VSRIPQLQHSITHRSRGDRYRSSPVAVYKEDVRPLIVLLATLIFAVACGGSSTSYTVKVAFNDTYTDSAGHEVELVIHAYDSGAQVLLQETFPPSAVATVRSGSADFCDRLRAQLEPRPDVARVDCARS